MKKVLFISSRPLYPIISGIQIRTAQQLEFLMQRYNVDVIYQSEETGGEKLIREQLPRVGKIICFKLPKWKSYLQTLRFLFNRLPLQVNYYYEKKIQTYIDKHLNEYDIVFCNNIRTTQYVINAKNILKYVDFVDALSMNYEKAQQYTHGIWKWIYAIEYKRCSVYERQVLSSFEHCAIISEVDKQYLLSHSHSMLHVVGNKVNIPDEALISQHENWGNIIFIGKMNYEPNIVAVTYFAEHIFPKLMMHHPSLRFVIVGALPDARVQKLGTYKNIIVTGYVNAVEPYYQKATIVACPMLTGAGIQNKIIQAMAYGCCIVTTPIGAEGLNIQHGELAIANENNMVQTILSLLENKQKRKDMGKAAREYVIKNLSEQVISQQFWKFMNQ